VKQFLKNKRKNHYRNGWLDVPDKYAYLKTNAGMRDPTASRKKKALSSTAAAKEDLRGPGVQRNKKAARVVENDNDSEGEEEEEEEEDNEAIDKRA